MAPNLFIVGAMKSGTTSLYHYLSKHPEIFFPDVKEPHYYALNGMDELIGGNGDAKRYKDTFVTSKKDYLELYRDAASFKYRGDGSAMYLYFKECASRIKKESEDARIIISIRNPLERAYSSYKHLVRDGREDLTFENALSVESQRIDNKYLPIWYYVQAGMYHDQIEKFYSVFGKDKVKVVLYEELKSDSQSVVSELFEFLNLSDLKKLDTSTIYNASGVPKNRTFQSIITSDHPIKKSFVKLIPKGMRDKLKSNLQSMNFQKFPSMQEETRAFLHEQFKEDVHKLSNLIDMDLNKWGFDG